MAEDATPTVRIEDGVPWIGERSFPWAYFVRCDDLPEDVGVDFRTRAFQLRFENGWTLSVAFGTASYSANHDHGIGRGEWHEESPDAELAAFPPHSDELAEWATGDTVLGYVPADMIHHVIDVLSSLPSEYPKGRPLGSPLALPFGLRRS